MLACSAWSHHIRNVLHIVCAGVDSVIELLVNSGYDVNAQTPDGITALMIACRLVCLSNLLAVY